MPKVVITMPAYEAEGTLERTVMDIPVGVADELILVDDASRDGTAELARGLGIRVHVHQVNRGYGGNQKSCYSMALDSNADIVVLLHPDYQYEPKAVPLLIAPILAGDADMTFGSRFAGMGDPLAGGMPLYRYLGNRITTITQNLLIGTRFTDMHSGMRAYTRRCLESLPFLRYSEGFPFDAELLVDAVTSGQRVVEVPIPTRYTELSSSISVGRSLDYVVRGSWRAARAGVQRGRRGRRYLPGWRRQPVVRPKGTPVGVACVVCGSLLSTTDAVDAPRQIEIVEHRSSEHDLRETFRWTLDRIHGYHLSGRRIFAAGSDVGSFLSLARGRGMDVSGIDPSEDVLRDGRQRFDIELRREAVETVDEPSGSANVVVLLDVLAQLVDPAAALQRIRPILVDYGLLALTIDIGVLDTEYRAASRPHLHRFGPGTIARLLSDNGFDPVEWSAVPRGLRPPSVTDRATVGSLGSELMDIAATMVGPRMSGGRRRGSILVLARPRPGLRRRG